MRDGLFNPFFTGNYSNPYAYYSQSGGAAVLYEDGAVARYEDNEVVEYES